MVKKNLILIVMLLFFSFCFAQNDDHELKLYRHEISLGIAKPFNSGLGFSFATEPKFAVIKKLAVGLRLEGLIWLDTDNQATLGYSESFSYSLVPTVDYYFTKSAFRPFVGVGYGLYFYSKSSSYYENANNPGMLARVGFEAGHFRLGIQYNHITRNYKPNGNSSGHSVNWGYFDLKLGVVIGSGNKTRGNRNYYKFN